jgi:hypothetical protein
MILWLSGSFILIVHWLLGKKLARAAMFAVMVTATCLYAPRIAMAQYEPSFVPPVIAMGVALSWFLSGIPYRYHRRQVKKLASELAILPEEQIAYLRSVVQQSSHLP